MKPLDQILYSACNLGKFWSCEKKRLKTSISIENKQVIEKRSLP